MNRGALRAQKIRNGCAAGAAAVLLLAGSGLFGTAADAAAAESPVKIMGVGVFNSTEISLPDASAAMEARVDQLNASGGLKGHRIDLTICNDQFDPNQAATCARQAVSGHDVAVISSYEPFTTQVDPILEQAGIPLIYSTIVAPVDATDSISFPRDGGVPAQYAALGVRLVQAGCKKVGVVVTGLADTELGGQWLAKGVKSAGGSSVSVSVSASQASFAPQVAQLEGDGAKCIVPATAPEQGAQVVTAVVQSGQKEMLGGTSSEFPEQSLSALGSAANGLIMTGQEYRPTDTQIPAVAAVIAGMKKYEPSVPLTDIFGISGWAGASAAAQVISTVSGPITARSVLAAANKATNISTGLYAPFSSTAKAPVAAFPRAKNWSYLTWHVDDGKATLVGKGFTKLTGL
jgi:branched-chain amino acid transport system substrate-binding protein